MTTWRVTRSRASTFCVAWACPAKQAWAPRGATAPAPQLATQVFPELTFCFNITFQLSRVNPKTLKLALERSVRAFGARRFGTFEPTLQSLVKTLSNF